MDTDEKVNKDKPSRRRIRLVRPSVIVLCGPAACGKSTFAERHFRPTQIISSDWARARVCDDERDQRFNAQAFALVHFLIEQRLGLNRLCVVDSTALTSQARRDLLELARKYQVPCVALLFDVPLEACVDRDHKRERSVGRAVIERQYEAFELAKASLKQEGFDQVIELKDEDLDRVETEIMFRPVARPATRPTRPNQQGGLRSSQRFGAETAPLPPRPPAQPTAQKGSNTSGLSASAGTAVRPTSPQPSEAFSGTRTAPRPGSQAAPPQTKGQVPSSPEQSNKSSGTSPAAQHEEHGHNASS